MDIETEAQKIIKKSKLAVSGDGGHNTTFAVACTLARLSSEEEVLMRWLRAYNDRLDEKWTERELYHKAEGAARAVSRSRRSSYPEPRVVPKGKSTLWKLASNKQPSPAPDVNVPPGSAAPAEDVSDDWNMDNLYTPPRPMQAYAGIS